VMEGDSSV